VQDESKSRSVDNSEQMLAPDGGELQHFSLLWPPHVSGCTPGAQPDTDCVRDIGLENLVSGLSARTEDRRAVEQVLLTLCQDPEVIHYRQNVLDDFLGHPALSARLTDLLPRMDAVVRYSQRVSTDRSALQEVIWRLGELESYVECMQSLDSAFAETRGDLGSEGLGALRREAAAIVEDETFQRLARELPDLLTQLRSTVSVTIGVNLDDHLQPVEATLLAINSSKFRSGSFLSKLFGAAANAGEGIAPLHGIAGRDANGRVRVPGSSGPGESFSPMLVPLFRDLALILERAARPIAQTLRRYAGLNTGLLADLRRELPFYLGAVRLIERMRAHGLSMCRPALAPAEERVCEVQDAYNINLALHLGAGDDDRDLKAAIVANEIAFGPAGRIIVLTGPNQGGKTTYIQSIGLIQVMAQAGLYVPGRRAHISPVDGLYTHFPTEEVLEKATGRFGDEAKRLHSIFARVTRHSLVLLNESLSGTSAGESLYLCQDILRVLRLLGARGIFSTHLHELAASIDDLNAAEPGDSKIVSMVASPIYEERAERESLPGGVEGHGEDVSASAGNRSYRVVFAPPMGRSYAQETARRYGVSYDQLRGLLRERGMLGPLGSGPNSE
jgi:DNA mismatch repair protein MutS